MVGGSYAKESAPRGALNHDSTLPKYSIPVASDLSGVPQQQLRRMEESGLLTPMRTTGNTRRYSDDVSQLAEVSDLLEQAINAASIHQILALRAELTAALAENEALRRRLAISENHIGPDATADT